MGQGRHLTATILLAILGPTTAMIGACGGGSGLDDYYPPIPGATAGSAIATAGQVTEASQLVTGPAQSGLVGDFFIKNDKVTFIVQAPTRVIGVIPQGGNVVDAVLTDGTHQTVDDHFGELGLIYLFGRTCEPTEVDIVRDGSKGGVAVLRAVGKTGNDDFIDIKGIGVLPVDPSEDPAFDDGMDCATTYILEPGTTTLQVYHSIYNGGSDTIAGPMGTIADTGGVTEAFTNARGFERADISALGTLASPEPSDYVIYQGPGVSYGIIPRNDPAIVHTQASVAGVSIQLLGASSLLDILQPAKYSLHLAPGKGVLQRYDLAVGHDGADIDQIFRSYNHEPLQAVSGTVAMSGGESSAGARVGVFIDGNGNGIVDDSTVVDGSGAPYDRIITYMDVASDGTFSGQISTTSGTLLARAEIKNVGRSPAAPIASAMSLTIPSPIKVDYTIVDDETGQPIPGRLVVIGDHPAFPDNRVFEVYDRLPGVVTQEHSIRGTTVDQGSGADEPLYLPANGSYRIYVSHGTEWSMTSQAVDSSAGTAPVSLTFRLRHVNPTPGYYATDWHVHQVGSPDSNIASDERIRSAVSQGVEMFAVTDHDYVSDLQPLVESLGLTHLLRVVPGIESTPFAYGHYNAWPLTYNPNDASHGAIDWARGGMGDETTNAMTPGELYAAQRAAGAKMVQVNHPRVTGFTEFQGGFARANVKYDFDNRTIYGDYANADVANSALRLPDQDLWSDAFNGLEIWNGFAISDTDGDGLRENTSLDRVLHDWLSMLSLGFYVTPAGDSDTHTTVADPLGMPRTYVRVANDSADALADGTAVDAVIGTQTGTFAGAQVPRDVVITDGPMIDVQANGAPALGSVITSTNAPVTLTVTITSPDWAVFDTLEVFANATPGAPASTGSTSLVPLKCWTTRAIAALNAMDPCALAPITPEAMTVQTIAVGGGYNLYKAVVTVTLEAADIRNRAGATGRDAWLVFRARGDQAIFPVMVQTALSTDAALAAALSGDPAQLAAAMTGNGVPAQAITAPVFVDFDGGGYKAPFAPN
jgi:hypothetical protein